MSSIVKDPRNAWVGAMFTAVGAAAVLFGRELTMGSAGRMGPAYFPTILGVLMILVGVAAFVRALLRQGEALEGFHPRELVLVAGAVVGFGLVLRGAGLVPAVMLLVLGSGFASDQFNFKRFALLAAGLALFATLVFVKGLGVPLQAIGPWFGG